MTTTPNDKNDTMIDKISRNHVSFNRDLLPEDAMIIDDGIVTDLRGRIGVT
jgi:hypothetical protein